MYVHGHEMVEAILSLLLLGSHNHHPACQNIEAPAATPLNLYIYAYVYILMLCRTDIPNAIWPTRLQSTVINSAVKRKELNICTFCKKSSGSITPPQKLCVFSTQINLVRVKWKSEVSLMDASNNAKSIVPSFKLGKICGYTPANCNWNP